MECVQPAPDKGGVKTTGESLIELRSRAGISLDDVAIAAGYAGRSGVQRYFAADFEGRLSLAVAERLAKGLVGKGKPPITREEVFALAGLTAAQLAPSAPQSDQPPIKPASGNETATVQRLDLSYAMGPGTNLDDAHVEGEPVEFDIGFLRRLTPSPPYMLRIVSGVGDSMLPTVHDREDLIIDMAQRVLNMQDRIWAISLYGAGALKRLRTIGPGRVLVISDNPDVPDQEVSAEDISITGRLIGSIRRH